MTLGEADTSNWLWRCACQPLAFRASFCKAILSHNLCTVSTWRRLCRHRRKPKLLAVPEALLRSLHAGNHEWDYGPGALANFTQNPNVNFPILACNVDASKDPVLAAVIKPYTIITTASGIKARCRILENDCETKPAAAPVLSVPGGLRRLPPHALCNPQIDAHSDWKYIAVMLERACSVCMGSDWDV